MSNPKLSIIVPHYNSLELLKILVASIPKREEIQVIIVDDNSTKEKKEYLDFQKENPQILFLENTTGHNSAGKCRNVGLAFAKGEWLLFADADDYFVENMWEKIIPYLEQKEFDIVYFTPTSRVLGSNEPATRHVRVEKMIGEYLKKGRFYYKTKLRYWFEAPWSKLIRRSVVEDNKIAFDETKVANDVMFSMKVAVSAKDITASRETIYCITQSKGTLTTTPGRENFEVRFQVFLRKHRFLRENLNKREWRIVDILGEPYLKLARRNGIPEEEVKKIKQTLREEKVRIYIPRNKTWLYVIGKIRSLIRL